jgi:lysozyme
MNISQIGERLIGTLEDFREESYLDQSGTWTIGYGTTRINGAPVTMGMKINEPVGRALLDGRLQNTIETINDSVHVVLTQNQFDALCSLAYNIGEHNFLESSLLRAINRNEKIYRDLFVRWKYVTIDGQKVVSNGLLKRRNIEYDLFMEQ